MDHYEEYAKEHNFVTEIVDSKVHYGYRSEKIGYMPNPVTQEWLDKAYSCKLIVPKKELIDGVFYLGRCRNAEYARWNAKKEKFTYIRSKWCHEFLEDINHPEDDNGFDLFQPIAMINKEQEECKFMQHYIAAYKEMEKHYD